MLSYFITCEVGTFVSDKIQEESKKMEILMPHNGTTIKIVTDHPVKEAYSENSPIKINSASGEVFKSEPKRFVRSEKVIHSQIIRKKREIQKDNPFIRHFFSQTHSRKLQNVNSLTSVSSNLQNSSSSFALPQNVKKDFISPDEVYLLTKNMDLDVHQQKLQVAYNNVQNLEIQFRDVVKQISNYSDAFSIDANTKNFLENFVAHLDYIQNQQIKPSKTSPPDLYNYFTHYSMPLHELMTKNQWEKLKQESTLKKLIAAKTNPLSINSQLTYGPAVLGYNRRRKRSLKTTHSKKIKTNRKIQVLDQSAAMRKNNSTSPYTGYSRAVLPQKLTKEQIPVFILTTDGIGSHYEILFNMLPPKSSASTNVQNYIYQDALLVFHKVSLFSSITYMTLEKIWDDLDEIDVFFKAQPKTTLNTLSFYRLDDDYLKLKCQIGNRTTLHQQMTSEVINKTMQIANNFNVILQSVADCKADVDLLLEKTSIYRDYKGRRDLYSADFQKMMAKAIQDVAIFWNLKLQIDTHLKTLRDAEIIARNNRQELAGIIQNWQKKATEYIPKVLLGLMVLFLAILK